MKLFEKANGFTNQLFSKGNGKIFLRKAENAGREIIGSLATRSDKLIPMAMALGHSEIATELRAVNILNQTLSGP